MNAKEFVACWRREKDSLLDIFTDPAGGSGASQKIATMGLNDEQQRILKEAIGSLLNDTFYTLLMGLGGEANIGGVQASYTIHDEDGNVISPHGEIEGEAWEQFHGTAR